MSRIKSGALVILGIASTLGIAWLIRQRRKEELGGLPVWQQVLINRHGQGIAIQLVAAFRLQYAALIAETQMPENQALRAHLKENILPGLALYRVLLQEYHGNQQDALKEVDDALRVWTLAKSRWLLAPLKILPAPFFMFKLAFAQMMRKFPAVGWDFTYIENNRDKVAFNATRCYYLNTLTALGAPELTASFCKSDDVMAELFPPSIRFERPLTLGRGDQMCDFQYCRVRKT